MRNACCVAVLMLIGSAIAHADAPAEMTLEEKVGRADAVVRAECTGVRSEWVRNRIVTRSRFAVSSDLTQKGMREIEVTTPGGEAIHPVLKVKVRSTVSEQPEIQLHDQAILFTRRLPSGENVIVGGRQGYMRISDRVNEAGERLVPGERKIIAAAGTRGRQSRGAAFQVQLDSEAQSVNEVEQRVRSAIAARRQRR